ncbi:luciferin 4-monooxygenase-like [Hermetia illucens]|uniref:luciferin 4-monooxygenase-like n=1 Tax=Hermetia illucens TaxID=343691 RepID=UPI0018CC7AEC|nr:luciferin 4-monooxygenase-like [Hermetia illucens]
MNQLESNFDAKKKIWSGRKVKLVYNPKLTIGEVIRSTLQRNPKKIGQIFVDNGVRLSNGEILLRAHKIGYYLMERWNLQSADVVGLIARNTENLAPLVFGLFFCGVSVNSLDTSFSEDEIINIFKYTKPKLVFCDADVYVKVKTSLEIIDNAAAIYIVTGKVEKGLTTSVDEILDQVSDEETHRFSPNQPEDAINHPPMIICSSGTTGPAKGVCISHNSMLQQNIFMFLQHTDILLCFSSLYWLSGVFTLIRGTILGVTRIITSQPFTPELMLRLIEQYRITSILTPPSQLAMMVECPEIKTKDLSSLREYLCGGSFVAPALCDKMAEYLQNGRITVVYGSTEAGGGCTMNVNPYKYGSVGKLIHNFQMRIVDDNGDALGPNENGEICVKPLYKFLGYYGRMEDLESVVDNEGWIHTGDIGHIDDDGFLFIADRKKEIMKYKNFQFSPSELENFLLGIPGVSEVCVCGIPDAIYTDLPAAVIVRSKDSNIHEKDVENYVRSQLSDHKQLRGGIYFVDGLPMTASGKYKRGAVKEIAIELYRKRANDKNNLLNSC